MRISVTNIVKFLQNPDFAQFLPQQQFFPPIYRKKGEVAEKIVAQYFDLAFEQVKVKKYFGENLVSGRLDFLTDVDGTIIEVKATSSHYTIHAGLIQLAVYAALLEKDSKQLLLIVVPTNDEVSVEEGQVVQRIKFGEPIFYQVPQELIDEIKSKLSFVVNVYAKIKEAVDNRKLDEAYSLFISVQEKVRISL